MRTRAWSLLPGISLALILAPAAFADTPSANALLSNGVLAVGVSADAGLSEGPTGLQFVPTGVEGMLPNCACAPTLLVGTDALTQSVESFSFTGVSATSSVQFEDATTGATLRMVEQFQPATDAPNLYEVMITVENLGVAPVQPTYTRQMAWAGASVDRFQLDLGPIAAGGAQVFREYLGVGPTLADATAGFAAEGAQLVSQSAGPITFVHGYGLGAAPTATTANGGGGGGGSGGGGGGGGGGSGGAAAGAGSHSSTQPLASNPATVGKQPTTSNQPTTGNPPTSPPTMGNAPTTSNMAPTTGNPPATSNSAPTTGDLPTTSNTAPTGTSSTSPNTPDALSFGAPPADLGSGLIGNVLSSSPNQPVNYAATPELDSLVLFGTGVAGAAGYALMRRRASKRTRDSDSTR